MTQEWHQDFFNGLAVDFWVAVAPPAHDDLPFLASTFGEPAGKQILDLACGAGRHAIPLALSGYQMTGADLSLAFLARARDAALANGVTVEWHCGDIRELPWTDRFDGALCFGNSFGYFDRANTLRMLASIGRALKPGAPFVVETGTIAESLLPSLQERRWMQVDDILFLSAARYDVNDSRLDVDYSFIRGDARESKTAHNWIYTMRELRELFELSGFRVERMCASTAGEKFRLGSPKLLLTARKD